MLFSDSEIKRMVSEGKLIQGMIDKEKQIQQCGVDLTLSKVFSLKGEGVLDFDNSKRKIPEYTEIEKKDSKWKLEKGLYHFGINEKIILPKNIAALVLPRSSALCCGIELHSALWDPGYEGRGFLHAQISRDVEIYENAKIAQIIFMALNSSSKGYDGIYKGEDIVKNISRGNND